MFSIIRREWRNYFKNPLFIIGIIIVAVIIWKEMQPYLAITYLPENMKIEEKNPNDADVMDGYIPFSTKEKEQQMKDGFTQLKESLIAVFSFSEEKAELVISDIQNSNMTIKEIGAYMEKEYGYENADTLFTTDKTKRASVEDTNRYISQALKQKPFTYYFSFKYVDYMAVEMGFFCIVLFVFSFIWESKRDMYELIHTKPIKASSYVLGKIIGNITMTMLVIIIITGWMDVVVVRHCIRQQLPYSIWDIWIQVGVFLLPCIFLIAGIYLGVSVLFKNPLPAVPALVLYMIYTNMGSVGADGVFGYHIRPFGLYIRFADLFFENSRELNMLLNQCLLIVFGVVLCIISSLIWKRRRVY